MSDFPKDLISILQYLLPGFLAAWVFYGFTSCPKPSNFERIVQALIFTLIIQSIVFIEKNTMLKIGNTISLGTWTKRSELLCSVISALFLGALFAYFTNNDKFHKVARKIGLTRETSYPSEWFGTFLKNITYIVVQLEDERRLYGWPIEWPSEPGKGHLVLEQPSWLIEKEEENHLILSSWLNKKEEVKRKVEQIPITGVSSIMINAKDVKWIEFMKKTWEKKNG